MNLAVKVVREGEDTSIWVNGKKYEAWFKDGTYRVETFKEKVGRAKSFGEAIGKAITHFMKLKEQT